LSHRGKGWGFDDAGEASTQQEQRKREEVTRRRVAMGCQGEGKSSEWDIFKRFEGVVSLSMIEGTIGSLGKADRAPRERITSNYEERCTFDQSDSPDAILFPSWFRTWQARGLSCRPFKSAVGRPLDRPQDDELFAKRKQSPVAGI